MWFQFPLGYAKVVQLLIDKGYTDQINSVNKWGNTPLHRAVEFGYEDVARLLIENGAEVSTASNDGWTALHYAAWKSEFQKCLYIKKVETWLKT